MSRRDALLYERLGKTDLAIADYDTLIALAPAGTFYVERRAELLKAKAEGVVSPVPSVVEPSRDAPS
jgi:hypothetical protein